MKVLHSLIVHRFKFSKCLEANSSNARQVVRTIGAYEEERGQPDLLTERGQLVQGVSGLFNQARRTFLLYDVEQEFAVLVIGLSTVVIGLSTVARAKSRWRRLK